MDHEAEQDPWVIRTDFSDDEMWATVCGLVSKPQQDVDRDFYAYVQFKDDRRFANLSPIAIVHALPDDYPWFFCFEVDGMTLEDDGHPVLVVWFLPNSANGEGYKRKPQQVSISDIKTLRAIPSTIQSIENNLSIANMDFEEFADSIDADGVFRGFP